MDFWWGGRGMEHMQKNYVESAFSPGLFLEENILDSRRFKINLIFPKIFRKYFSLKK